MKREKDKNRIIFLLILIIIIPSQILIAKQEEIILQDIILGYNYLTEYKKEQAIETFDRICEKAIKDGTIIEFLINLYLEPDREWYKRFEKEKVEKLKALKLDNDPNYDYSLEFWQKVVEQHKTNHIFYNFLALTYYLKGMYDEAIKYFKKSIKLRNDDFLTYYFLAKVYKDNDLKKLAIDTINDCIRIKPDYPFAYQLLGTIYQEDGKYELAIKTYKKLFKLNFDELIIYTNLLLTYSLKFSTTTITKLRIDKESLDEIFLCLEGVLTSVDKRISGKLEWEKVISFLDVFDFVYYGKSLKPFTIIIRGIDKLLLTEYVKSWQDRISKDSKDWVAYIFLILERLAVAEYDEVINYLGKLSKIKPSYEYITYKLMGDVYFLKRDYENAKQYYKKVIKLIPKWKGPYGNLGLVLIKEGKEKAAIPLLQKAYESEFFYSPLIKRELEKLGLLPLIHCSELIPKQGSQDIIVRVYSEIDTIREIIKQAGYSYRVIKRQLITKELLNNTHILLFIGKFIRKFSNQEIEAIKNFIRDGGRVIIIIERNKEEEYYNYLLAPFDIRIRNESFIARGEEIQVKDLRHHFITRGLKYFYIKNGVEILTPSKKDKIAYVGKAAVIVTKNYGDGKIIVAGIGTDNIVCKVWHKKEADKVKTKLQLLLNMLRI